MSKTFLVLIVVACLCWQGAQASEAVDKKDDQVTEVFILPHSHDDVGWLETIQGYMDTFVTDIYTTAVNELANDPQKRRKFQSVEQAFFMRWWGNATQQQQQQVKQLIAEGRWEFTIGGWVMQDEACTDYIADINQMEEGHRFIQDTFGVTPRFSFQVDPFGAASFTPTQFAMTGFDAHIISRIDFQKKAQMQTDQHMQFIWRANPSLGKQQEIFTHLMDQYSYCSPFNIGVYWDGSDDPNPDNRNPSTPLDKYNIQYVASMMADNIKQRAAWFRTPHLLWPFGCDFQFFNSTAMFDNMDKLIDYMNANYPQYHLRYATLSDYFDAIHKTNLSWPVRDSTDFFPYDDNAQSFWTGYFTSRNLLKGYARSRDNVLRTADSLYAVATMGGKLKASPDMFTNLDMLRQAQGEAQHHDAITGTERPNVAEMYMEHLAAGTAAADKTASDAIDALLGGSSPASVAVQQGTYFEKKVTPVLGKPQFVVLQNPLGWSVTRYMAVNVSSDTKHVVVTDAQGNAVPAQLSPAPESTSSHKLNNLFFLVTLPPMGYTTYKVEAHATSQNGEAVWADVQSVSLGASTGDFTLKNGVYNATFSGLTGLISDLNNMKSSVNVQLTQEYYEYHAYSGFGQASGNYIFRPDGPAHSVLNGNPVASVGLVQGPLVQQVFQKFDETHYQVYRMFVLPSSHSNAPGAEFVEAEVEVEHRVGPLDINRSLITRYVTDMDVQSEYYTDDNGYQMQKRVYNKDALLPIPGNYYPMINTVYMNNSAGAQFTVLSERGHGASLQKNGELEVMLHRREGRDDNRGESLPMDDQSMVRPRLNLIVDTVERSAELRHKASLRMNFEPTMFVTEQDLFASGSGYETTYAALKAEMPDNVHLLSLKTWNGSNNVNVVRLFHMYEAGEHAVLSRPVYVNLVDTFGFASVASLSERSLSAVLDAGDMQRWQWQASSEEVQDRTGKVAEAPHAVPEEHVKMMELQPATMLHGSDVDPTKLLMTPKNIRTFFVTA